MDSIKGAWRSVVIWFNGLLLAAFPLLEVAKESLPELAQYISPGVYKWMGLAVVLANIALRFKTSASLSSKA